MTRFVLTPIAVLLTACAATNPLHSPTPTVTPAQSLAIAASYQNHLWLPRPENAFHGTSPDGIRVDTPDNSHRPDNHTQHGWWKPHQPATGIPYQWGGFDTPQQFDTKIAAGHYAGDLYTPAKRRGLDAAVSRFATGIDCSGFVSRCWRLPASYSTRQLPELCIPLDSFDELEPGDIINKSNAHTVLFVRFVGTHRKYLEVYETGRATSWRVARHIIPRSAIELPGYRPLRYRHMAQ
ncbi:MAG: hypothetical protein P8J87_09560 [Verrucomicrobiales bacterium]|nr:hypothetical protein [Verrucomicrobiales bacterium]